MNKYLSLIYVVFFLCVVSCTKSEETGKKLRIRFEVEPPTIDWTIGVDGVSRDAVTTIHSGLMQLNKDSVVDLDLAESWTISSDSKIYTFKIRPTAKWSDGQPVVGQNFVDAAERVLSPKLAAEYSYFLFDILNAENYFLGKEKDFSKVGVSSPDPQTVVYTLRSPAPYWINIPSFFTMYPIRKDLIEKYGEVNWLKAGNLVTAGAYQLVSWERDSKMIMKKNPHYWNQEKLKEAFDEIELRIVKENSVAVTMFDRGEIDINTRLPPLQVPMLAKSNPGFYKSPFYRVMAIGFGFKNPVMKDKNLRLALSKSFDRSQFKKFLGDLVEPVQTWVPVGMVGADAKRGYSFNPAEAKEHLAKVKNLPASIEYWYPNDEKHKMAAEFLQSEWKKNLGLEVILQAQDWKVFLKTIVTGNSQIFRNGWGADYADTNNFLDTFRCNTAINNTKFCNKDYEKLLDGALNTSDPVKRAELYSKAEDILLKEEVAIAPLYQENNVFLVNPRLKGFTANKMGEYRLVDVR